MNNLPKRKQLLIVWSLLGAILVLFCMTGCGGSNDNTFKFRVFSDGSETSGCGVTFPGYGALCSSGCGFDNCLWPETHKVVVANIEGFESNGIVLGCDTRFYGCSGCFLNSKCLGCTPGEKSTYFGCTNASTEQGELTGFFLGSSDGKETVFGCAGGNWGCIDSEGTAYDIIRMTESALGIE